MNVPRFWQKVTGEADAPDGARLELTAWGWSHSGLDEARRNAAERLRRMIGMVRAGELARMRYPYGTGALREEIVEEVVGSDDEPLGLITRNVQGALVLNVPDVMFIDVDLPPRSFGEWLRGLFSRKPADPDAPHVEKLRAALAGASDATFRIYRTAAGFRVLATSRKFEPGSAEAERIMTAAGADSHYVQLCRAQKSFRARLSPKPWRCDSGQPPSQYLRTPEQ